MAISQKKVVVVGSINVDRFTSVGRLPAKGETLTGTDGFFCVGGKGANSAAVASKMGAECNFICSVGSDGSEGTLIKVMKESGVNMDNIHHSQKCCGQAFIFSLPDGDNCIVLDPAANRDWPDFTEQQKNLIQSADIILLQREIPEEKNIQAAQIANEANVPVCFDAGGEDTPISKELLSLVTIFSPNETELTYCIDTKNKTNEECCEELQKLGVKNVLLKLGEKGAFYKPADGPGFSVPAFKIDPVDTTGAGDCFTGAFAVKYAEGVSSQEAVRFACAAGGAMCLKVGTIPAIPSREEVQEFINSHN